MSSAHPSSLSMSTIDISLARESRKRVGSIKLSTRGGGSLRDTQITLRAGDTHREKFDPPLVVESDDHIFVSAGCSRFYIRNNVIVDIDLADVECMREDQGIKSYRKTTRNVEVVVSGCPPVSPPPCPVPTTSGPKPERPTSRFRVLVIGNSGVGKSTLIRKMFGVEDVHVSQTARGTAEIDREFVSRTNERFVVHDSLGFEAGDEARMDIVKDFLKRRQAMPRLEDQLHAIWLCMEIPHSGGRFLEGGVERFLQHQSEIIGNIPLIVVLTKMDLLDIYLNVEAPGKEPLESRRSKYIENIALCFCAKPRGRRLYLSPFPVTMEGYFVPISNLMKATNENMARHAIHEAPRAMASIAQRVDMKAKIEMSITVGEKKYWQNLQDNPFFHGRTLGECLVVIREDIVTIWNLIGLDRCLMDDQFILALVPADVFGSAGTSQPTM
ncbi:hypothetical protein JVU11DRAFT_6896 [Chiua virens]|nr:hypothetical protein JVU11DRAFT_6896 [Chiua virens]